MRHSPDHSEHANGSRAHRTDVQVRFGDTDALGHVNNASFAQYAEAGRLDFLEAVGQDVGSIILAHLAIDFRSQVRFGEAVHVDTRVDRLGRTSVTLLQAVIADGRPAAEMRSVVVLFDYERHAPRELPPELRARLAPYLCSPSRPAMTNGEAGRPDADAGAGLAGLGAGDASLRPLLEEVRARMACDAAHDIGHLMRVARWTVRLLRDLPGGEAVSPRLAVAAALLHDVVNIPKTDPARATASAQSAAAARELLPRFGFTPAEVELAAAAIVDHSYTRGAVPASALGTALQDADRLEALGAVGVFRCIATGVRFGAAFFDPDDPWARARPLDDAAFSLDHFFTKLLRLPPTLLTPSGRAEAERRAAAMRALLAELGEEIGSPWPDGGPA